jgi:ankyrin repeat protein
LTESELLSRTETLSWVKQEHGADIEIEAEDYDSRTALYLAAMEGHLAVVNLLSPNDSNGATSILLGKRKSQGENVEAKGNHGDTPLHKACPMCHLAVVKALLSSGADILARNMFLFTMQ